MKAIYFLAGLLVGLVALLFRPSWDNVTPRRPRGYYRFPQDERTPPRLRRWMRRKR